MKKIIALVMALCMVFALCACGKSAPEADSTKLILGTSADYAPYEFMYADDNGEMVFGGIDVLAAQYLAEAMGKELQIENMSFDYLLTALSKGDYDIVMAAMEVTDERLQAADFSDPYCSDLPAKILVKAENADQYASLSDFDGKSVGAQTATTKEGLVTEKMPGANLVSVVNVDDIVNQLVYDKLDACVLDGAVAVAKAEANPDLVVLDAVVIEEAPAPYCVAVAKGDPKGLLPALNEAIAKMNEAGVIEDFRATATEMADLGLAQEVSVDAPES